MRALPLTVGVLLLAACGDRAPAPRPVEPLLADGITLPTARHAVVRPIDEGTLFLDVTANGAIYLGTRGPLSLEGLYESLEAATASRAWRAPDHSSLRTLRVRIDASVPWVLDQWVLQVVADPRIGIWKVDIAVLGPSGRPAVLPVRLPKDRGVEATQPFAAERPELGLEVARERDEGGDAWTRVELGGGPVARIRAGATRALDLEGLEEAIAGAAERLGAGGDVRCRIVGTGPRGLGVAHGDAVAVLDAILGAGFEDWGLGHVVFAGADPPARDVVERSSALRAHLARLKRP